MKKHILRIAVPVSLAFMLIYLIPSGIRTQSQDVTGSTPGQTATLLPDGRQLLIGGEGAGGPVADALIWDPQSFRRAPLPNSLKTARAWHSATMLPDGTVLVFGGIGADGKVVESAELFDPSTQTFQSLQLAGLTARARHTATLLTDGKLVIVGGVSAEGRLLGNAEIWDSQNPDGAVQTAKSAPRQGHSATLLPDGHVLISGGVDRSGKPIDEAELFSPFSQRFTSVPSGDNPETVDAPGLVDSRPGNGEDKVAVDTVIALRFSKPLKVETLSSQTITLTGPAGVEQVKVVPAEAGILAFVTPQAPLLPGATYSVSINGAADHSGFFLPYWFHIYHAASVRFWRSESCIWHSIRHHRSIENRRPRTQNRKFTIGRRFGMER